MPDMEVLEHEPVFAPDRYFAQCHASTLERLQDGTLVCAFFAGTAEAHSDTAIWVSRNTGHGWSSPRIAADTPGVACWNPVLFARGRQLLLYFKSGRCVSLWKTMVSRSKDGGQSWSKPEELVKDDGGGRGPVKNKCIGLGDGTVLAPASIETDECWSCFTDRSPDGLTGWKAGAPVPMEHLALKGKGMIQPSLWQDETGRVHMLMRSTEGCLFSSFSDDRGQSWAAAQATVLPNNNSGIDLACLADGRLVLAYNPVAENWGKRTPIALAWSEDNGQSWSAPRVLEHDPQGKPWKTGEAAKSAEFSYPALIARGNQIFLTYTWYRKSIAYWRIAL
jgi:predicted neuraminidase